MNTIKDYRLWIRGLVAAAIGGGANAVTAMIVDPYTFNIATGMTEVGADGGGIRCCECCAVSQAESVAGD